MLEHLNSLLAAVAGLAILSAAFAVRGVQKHYRSRLDTVSETLAQSFAEHLATLEPACACSTPARALLRAMQEAAGTGRLSGEAVRLEIESAVERERETVRQPLVLQVARLLEGLHGASELLKAMEASTNRDRLLRADALQALSDALSSYKALRAECGAA